MTRVIVKFNDTNQFCNLEADEITEAENFARVYKGNEVVGIFDLTNVKEIYKTECKEWNASNI